MCSTVCHNDFIIFRSGADCNWIWPRKKRVWRWCHGYILRCHIDYTVNESFVSKLPIFKYASVVLLPFAINNCALNGEIGYCLRFNIRHIPNRATKCLPRTKLNLFACNVDTDRKDGIIIVFIFLHSFKIASIDDPTQYIHWCWYLSCAFFCCTVTIEPIVRYRQVSKMNSCIGCIRIQGK